MLSIFTSLFSKAGDLKVGEPAPKVSVLNEMGEETNLENYYKKGYVLVYFYPKADTPGCTAQACSLRDSYAVLQNKGVTVLGVSTDTVEDQKKFKDKYHLPFHLLADVTKKAVKAFGVPMNLGFAARQAFLIKNGTVVWLDRKASTNEQANDVLKVLESQQ